MIKNIEYKDRFMKYYLDQYCSSLTADYIMDRCKETIKKQASALIDKKIIKSFNVDNDELLTDYIEKYLNIIKEFTYKENDSILNYLNYWHKKYILAYRFNIFKNVEIDKLWLLSESNKNKIDTLCNSIDIKDYVKLNGLCTTIHVQADTIFSAWTPIKNIIKIIFKVEVTKNHDDFIFIKEHLSEIEKNHLKLYEALNNFTKLASTRGNVIEYPYYPGDKHNFQTRGNTFQDLFLISLKECFDGTYSHIFENEKSNYNSIHKWINDQHLYYFFNHGKTKKYNKEDLIVIKNKRKLVQDSDTKNWSNTNEKDMICILKKYTKIIEKRNEKIYSKNQKHI